jgi:hypothetical protein
VTSWACELPCKHASSTGKFGSWIWRCKYHKLQL